MTATLTLTQYFAKSGSHLSDRDAAVIGPELARLEADGPMTAAVVVDAARDTLSPLHSYFEWDDSTAAELFRQEQARTIMRSIEVVVTHEEGAEAPQRLRAFYAVRQETSESTPRQQQYVSIARVTEQPDAAAQVIAEAQRYLAGWAARYRLYRDTFPAFDSRFEPVFNAIDKIGDL